MLTCEQDYDWGENKAITKEELLRELYCQGVFASACVARRKKGRFSFVMLKCEMGGLAVVELAKVVVLPQLRRSRGDGER